MGISLPDARALPLAGRLPRCQCGANIAAAEQRDPVSVEQVDVVDSIGVESTSGKLIMTISDHLDWDGGGSHQAILQEKLNTYLTFIESGEITTAYPDLIGRPIAISVVMRTSPTPDGDVFFEQVKLILAGIDIELRTTILEPPE